MCRYPLPDEPGLILDDLSEVNESELRNIIPWYTSKLPGSNGAAIIGGSIVLGFSTKDGPMNEQFESTYNPPANPGLEARVLNLETLIGLLIGQLLGQVALNPELLAQCAEMNRRNRVEDFRVGEELSIVEASRRNLLAFAKELNVPESALPVASVTIPSDLEPGLIGAGGDRFISDEPENIEPRKSYNITINGMLHTVTNVTSKELSEYLVKFAPEGGEISINLVGIETYPQDNLVDAKFGVIGRDKLPNPID